MVSMGITLKRKYTVETTAIVEVLSLIILAIFLTE